MKTAAVAVCDSCGRTPPAKCSFCLIEPANLIDVAAYHASASEADMTRTLRELAEWRRGRLWHIERSDVAPEMVDFTDIALILPPYVGLFELKGPRTPVTAGQLEVARLLSQCDRFLGGIVRAKPRPGELSFDAVLQELTA